MIIDTCNNSSESQMECANEESEILKVIQCIIPFILHSRKGKIIGFKKSVAARDRGRED